jgi:hypothetical protein
MDADGQLFRLVSEAKRISLAWLFDPFLAVQTSNLDPLPHQIDGVYTQMLPRQPLRYSKPRSTDRIAPRAAEGPRKSLPGLGR